MTKTSRSDDCVEASIEDYQHTVLGRLGSKEERKDWLEENNIDDFKQMIFARDNHYYIFRNAADALKFKVVWG